MKLFQSWSLKLTFVESVIQLSIFEKGRGDGDKLSDESHFDLLGRVGHKVAVRIDVPQKRVKLIVVDEIISEQLPIVTFNYDH